MTPFIPVISIFSAGGCMIFKGICDLLKIKNEKMLLVISGVFALGWILIALGLLITFGDLIEDIRSSLPRH